MIRKQMKDYQGAIADFTEAIDLEPDCAVAYSNRGATKMLLEPADLKGAFQDVYRSCDLFLLQGEQVAYQQACELLQALVPEESMEA
jgi:tetratricopeptide (TPR) repeat protein